MIKFQNLFKRALAFLSGVVNFGWSDESTKTISNQMPENNETTAQARLNHLVSAWNQSSFEAYCGDFTQSLTDHYNPGYFTRIRTQCGQWLSNQYLGCLKHGRHYLHLWSSRFEGSQNDVLFSLTLTEEGKIAGLLKRFSKV